MYQREEVCAISPGVKKGFLRGQKALEAGQSWAGDQCVQWHESITTIPESPACV